MTQNKVTVSRVVPSANIASPRLRIRPVTAEAAPSPPADRPSKRRRVPFKKADLARAVSAVAKAGFVAGSVEVATDGTIRIYAAGAEPTASLFDQWADKL